MSKARTEVPSHGLLNFGCQAAEFLYLQMEEGQQTLQGFLLWAKDPCNDLDVLIS